MGKTAYAAATAAILCLALLCAGHGSLAGELPPLEVGEDAPRLKEADEEEKEQEGPTADNHHCFVCHGNYRGERLTEVHSSATIGCMDCHGSSDDHRGDEANITPPDRMFPSEDINPYCRNCHKEHDVKPEKMIDRWLERGPHRTGAERTVCTDCHGQHRLDNRDTRWNKRTGELLHPLKPALPEAADADHYDDVYAPKSTKLVSAGKPVTSSVEKPMNGSLEEITDGAILDGNGPQVTLPEGRQWIQLDLGDTFRVHAIMIWHAPGTDRTYRDVVVRLSENGEFEDGVHTVFNNDVDNSSGLGRGLDGEWTESPNGKLVEVDGARTRYVRIYSNGNSENPRNHYAEVRVYGVPAGKSNPH